MIFEIGSNAGELNEFVQVFGQRFVGLIDNIGLYTTYRVPNPQAPYPQDYIIDQQGIVRYWSDEYDPQKIMKTIDGLLAQGVGGDGSNRGRCASLIAQPSPFRRGTEIRFAVPEGVSGRAARPGTRVIKIFDAAGRLIRYFDLARQATGSVLHWDGRDESGDQVPAGVYTIILYSAKSLLASRAIFCP